MDLKSLAAALRSQIVNNSLEITASNIDMQQSSIVFRLLSVTGLQYIDISPAGIVLSENDTVLTLSGEAEVYAQSMKDLEIVLKGDDNASRSCAIAGVLDTFDLRGLVTYRLVDPTNLANLPSITFDSVALSLDSATLSMGLSVNDTGNTYDLLPALGVNLRDLGFNLSRTYDSRRRSVTAQLDLLGIFNIADTIEIGTDVILPANAQSPEYWRLTLGAASEGMQVSVANLIKLVCGTNLFAAMPTGLAALSNFELRNLSIAFDPGTRNVSMINTTIATVKRDWQLMEGFLLWNPNVSFLILNPTTKDPQTTVVVNATFILGTQEPRIALDTSLTMELASGNWTIRMSTDKSLNLSNMAGIPGGVDFESLALPDKLNNPAAVPVILEEFTIEFNTRNVTLNGISLTVYTSDDFKWVIGDVVTISQLYFHFAVTDPLNRYSQRDLSLVFSGNLAIALKNDQELSLDLRMELISKTEGWLLSASLAKKLLLTNFFDSVFGTNIDWPDSIKDINLSVLNLQYYTKGQGRLIFDVTVSDVWTITLGEEAFAIESISAHLEKSGTVKNGSLSGNFNIFGLELNAKYIFSDTNKQLQFSFPQLQIVVAYDEQAGTLSIKFGQKSLGEMIAFMYGLATGVEGYTLPAPWNILNTINLNGFDLIVKLSDKTVSFKYNLPSPVNLGFITINALNISKDNAGKAILSIDCVFMGQTYGGTQPPLKWDMAGTEPPPGVPGFGSEYFDLQFLGAGQHVAIVNYENINSVTEAVTKMKDSMPVPAPGVVQNPLKNVPTLKFDGNSGWLIGTRFVVMQTVNLSAVFNDPNLYGLAVSIAGEKIKVFKGLKFEILYKKINDTVGVYQIVLQLPDMMRNLQFGQVSVTLPVIGIAIYTDGSFLLDLGFPYNNDFTRSFCLQVFPFIGYGGFYFGVLSQDAATRLPASFDKNTGTFSPVIDFGLGLSVGLGKTIEMGILSAGVSITVQGVIEGTIAMFNANKAAFPSKQDDQYYWLQGSVSLVGKIYATINFAIIKASLNIEVYIALKLSLQSYADITIAFEAGIKVSLTVEIDLWLFTIRIALSFNAKISEQFIIEGSKELPPWVTAQQQLAASRGRSLLAGANACDAGTVNWKPFEFAAAEKSDAVIYFMPQFTTGTGDEEKNANYAVMSVYLSVPNEAKTDAATNNGFFNYAESLFYWAVASIALKDSPVTTKQQVKDAAITFEQMNQLFCALSGDQNPFTYAQIAAFLNSAIRFDLQTVEQVTADTGLAAFPMIPDTKVKVTLDAGIVNEVDFTTRTRVTESYNTQILQYFQKLFVDYVNQLGTSGEPEKALPEETEQSLATFIFEDYTMMLLRFMVQNGIDTFKNFQLDYTGQQIGAIVSDYYDTYNRSSVDILTGLANANATVALKASQNIAVRNMRYAIRAGDTFASVLTQLQASTDLNELYANFASLNSDLPGLLRAGTEVKVNSGTYILVLTDTIESVSTAHAMTPAEFVVLNKDTKDTMQAFFPLPVPGFTYKTKENDTLRSVAGGYTLSPYDVIAANQDMDDLFVPGILVLPQLDKLKVSDLLNALIADFTFDHLAGLASRFMLHGLRVPPPKDAPVNVDDSKTYGIYQLTGQQFVQPAITPQSNYAFDITLGGQSWPSLTRNMVITGDQKVNAINALLNAPLQPVINRKGKMEFSKVVARRYSLTGRMYWQCEGDIDFIMKPGIPPVSIKAFTWNLPDGILKVLNNGKLILPALIPYIASQPDPSLPVRETEIKGYSWLTAISLRIRQAAGQGPFMYEIIGADATGTDLLKRLLDWYRDNPEQPVVKSVYLLYGSNPAGSAPSGMQSQGIGQQQNFLVQTNLSTQSHPLFAFGNHDTEAEQEATNWNTINLNIRSSIQLLWQASLTRSGGYYLYYKNTNNGAGIPDSAFDDHSQSTLRLSFVLNITDGLLPSFVNALVIADPIDDGAVPFCKFNVRPQQVSIAGHTPADFMRDYRLSWKRLAKGAAAIKMRGGARLRIVNAVPSTQNGMALSDVIALAGLSQTGLPHYNEFKQGLRRTVALPAFEFAVTDKYKTLQTLATAFGTSVERLLFDNKDIPFFEDGEVLEFDDVLEDKYATILPGNTAFRVDRKNPQQASLRSAAARVSPEVQKEELYNLLSYAVKETPDFNSSVWAMPIGASEETATRSPHEQIAPVLFSDLPDWSYTQVIPVAVFAKTPPSAKKIQIGAGPFSADTYGGVGKVFSIDFIWQDLFGNQPAADAGYPFGADIKIGYFDRLLGVTDWPSVAAGYAFAGVSPDAQISLSFSFDPTKYIPRKKANCEPPDGYNEQFYKDQLMNDFMSYRTIGEQLFFSPGISMSLATSLNDTPVSLSPDEFKGFLTDIPAYLAAMFVSPDNVYVYYNTPGSLDLETIVTQQGATSLNDLLRLNPGIINIPAAGTCIVIPKTAVPADLIIAKSCTLNTTEPVFKLLATVSVVRDTDLIDDQFLDVPEVISSVSTIRPQTNSSVVTQLSALDEDNISDQQNLRVFALSFEKAFPGLKAATGRSSSDDASTQHNTDVWAIQFNTNGYSVAINGNTPAFYAPMPLFNQLITGNDFTVYNYSSSAGLETDKPLIRNFASIDLDVWARTFLSGMDNFFSPVIATAALMIDQQMQTDHYQSLLAAKRNAAEGIIRQVISVLVSPEGGSCTNPYTDPTEEMTRLARESLLQQLLVSLENAYSVSAVVQFPVDVKAPAAVDNDLPPRLFGSLPTLNAEELKDVGISTSRIQLRNGKEYLTFILTTKQQTKNIGINLEFQPNAFEHEIKAPDDLGYQASSWLNFIISPPAITISPDEEAPTRIPLPLRAYPIPPSLLDQTATGAAPEERNANFFADTRNWEYTYKMDGVQAQQDIAHMNVRFNVQQKRLLSQKDASLPDLFESLAMFISVWPLLESDLTTIVGAITTDSTIEQVRAAEKVMAAMDTLATQVGDAWGSWLLVRDKYRKEIDSLDQYEFTITDNSALGDPGKEFTVRIVDSGAQIAPEFPEPVYEGYKTEKLKASLSGQENTYHFLSEATQKYMTIAEAAVFKGRKQLIYNGLDIFDKQNAWAGVYVIRNSYLYDDADGAPDTCLPTDSNFIYRSAVVRFSNIVTPLLNFSDLYDINALPGSTDKTLEGHLRTMFRNMFDSVTGSGESRTLRVGCTYSYPIAEVVPGMDPLTVQLPVGLVPPFEFRIPDDYGTGVNNFTGKFAEYISNWYKGHGLSGNAAMFMFDLSVYSNLDKEIPLPVYQMTGVYLNIADITGLE